MRFDYLEPTTIEEAVSLLNKHGGKAKVIAGGTDLGTQIKNGVVQPEYVIDIGCIPGLAYVNYNEKKGLKIGALTTLRQIEKSAEVQQLYPVLSQAASQVASIAIRNVATIGGNLCQDTKCLDYAQITQWGYVPCYRGGGNTCYSVKGAKRCTAMAIAETAPALICLGATARISGPNGERTIPLEDFFISSGVVALGHGEILTAIEMPDLPPNTKGAYLKHSLRGTIDFALVGVATVLTTANKACEDARIGLLGVARTPLRARQAESTLKGKKIDEVLIDIASQAASQEAKPIADRGVSAVDKRRMIRAMVKQAIARALAK